MSYSASGWINYRAPEVQVKSTNLLELLVAQIEISAFQVGDQAVVVVGLRDDGNTTLSSPPQQDLRLSW